MPLVSAPAWVRADDKHAKHGAPAATVEDRAYGRPGDPKMLDQVKVGDKVKFQAELLPGGRTVVTRIETVK